MQDTKEVQQYFLALLRKHASDEKKFEGYLKVLDRAVEQKLPFSSLSNQVLDKNVLAQCLSEIRQVCDFPIRPETFVHTSTTVFQEKIAKWASCEERNPEVVPHVLLYLRGHFNGVYTMAKVFRALLVQKLF